MSQTISPRERARFWGERSLFCLALASVFLAACAGRFEHMIEQDLKSREDLSCRAYLAWEREPVQDAMLWLHGTGPASMAFVHPNAVQLLKTHPVAYLTLDKPGVRAPFGDPADMRRDDAAFARHTQGDLLECAKQALVAASERFGPTVQLHLRGHSEGALISLYLLDALLEEQPEGARQVRSLILTGLPLEPFSQIMERQLGALPAAPQRKLRTAIATCNWPVMRDQYGFSCAYLKDAQARPSGFEMFQRLAKRSVSVPIYVFHGKHDLHTPASEVDKLQRWNAAVGHLDLNVRFYDGAHRGSPQVAKEMQELFSKLTSSDLAR